MTLEKKIELHNLTTVITITEDGTTEVKVRGYVPHKSSEGEDAKIGLNQKLELNSTQLESLQKLNAQLLADNQAKILSVIDHDISVTISNEIRNEG